MTINERLEKMRQATEIALEAAYLFGHNVWVEGEDEDAQLLIGCQPTPWVGISFDEWIEHRSLPGVELPRVARWYVWRMGYAHATRHQPEEYYDVEITKTEADGEAVVAAVLDLVSSSIDGALTCEAEAEYHGVAPATRTERFNFRVQFVARHLEETSRHLGELARIHNRDSTCSQADRKADPVQA